MRTTSARFRFFPHLSFSIGLALAIFLTASSSFAEGEAAATPTEPAPADVPKGDDVPNVPEAPAVDVDATTPDATNEPAIAIEVAPTPGSLTLSATPNGRVFVDGVDTGMSTPLVDFPIEIGTHEIRVVEDGTGREQTITVHVENGNELVLNVNLGEAPVAEPAVVGAASPPAATDTEAEDDWTWMSVVGWGGVTVGAIGLLASVVILSQPNANNPSGPLGFGLFGLAGGLAVGGALLLFFDSEFANWFGDDEPKKEEEETPPVETTAFAM